MPREPGDLKLAAVLRELREDRELTHEELAWEAGISPGTVSRLEAGQTNPSWTTVCRLAEALGISLGELGRLVEAAAGR